MPDFQLDHESVSRAETLSSRLMQRVHIASKEARPFDIQRLFSKHEHAAHAEGVPIDDVVSNVGQMGFEFAIARSWGNKIVGLTMDDGGLAPISMREILGGSLWSSYGPEEWVEREFPFSFPRRSWQGYLRRSTEEDERLIVTDVDAAEEHVERSLSAFLSYRFAGFKKWGEWVQGIENRWLAGPARPSRGSSEGGGAAPLPPAVGPGGGLQVQVSCLTPGLRLHISPAYFIDWTFFGSPSTPVSSYVLPGRYVFAADGPMLPKRTRDHGVFSVPPTYYPALTRF